MRIAVVGLWHLGTVTAACLSASGHEVTGIDEDSAVISALQVGRLPVQEPGLGELIETQLRAGKLRFSSRAEAVSGHEVVWLAFDTPVDENDVADVEYVFQHSAALLAMMSQNAIMLVSSQMPVGSIARLESYYRDLSLTNQVRFACAPENLRLGNAIEGFMQPDRVVVGIRSAEDKERLLPIWEPFKTQIEWMSVESAEMTKHAINAFLATSVAFINEIARICERIGADAIEVERGLKSDMRIGRRAYLHPGAAFAGGTLARDVMFLRNIASENSVDPTLFNGVKLSNDIHQNWLQSRFTQCVGDPLGKNVAVLGLTYKPGTSTLRRSSGVEACRWLSGKGARVTAYDPAVTIREHGIPDFVHLADAAEKVVDGADALVVTTEWPEFRALSPDVVARRMKSPIVIDPSGYLEQTLGRDGRIRYYSVGRSR
jgi:UDPglucose 6-dehydrogenase